MKVEKGHSEAVHKDLKYLITSLDDLSDVVNMVWGMMGANSNADGRIESAKAIVPSSMPLKHDSGSFIINLKVPGEIWDRCHADKSKK